MMALQAPIRRAEERFDVDEPVGIFATDGALYTGRAKDMSLSGVGIKVDSTRAFRTSVGEQVRVFVPEVGFVEGLAVRKSGDFLGVQFNLRPSIERDLLIRKLFTAAVANASVDISVVAATGMLLKSIWSAPTPSARITPEVIAVPAVEKLPAASLVIPPRAPAMRLEKIVADRRAMAA